MQRQQEEDMASRQQTARGSRVDEALMGVVKTIQQTESGMQRRGRLAPAAALAFRIKTLKFLN